MAILTQGDNFELQLLHGLIELSVWARPDLSHERGAELAGAMADAVAVAFLDRAPRGLLLNLMMAPHVIGPVTESHLRRIVATVVNRRQPMAIATDDALLSFQTRGILEESAPAWTRQCADVDSARRWLLAFPAPR